jgi:hypothetical protein
VPDSRGVTLPRDLGGGLWALPNLASDLPYGDLDQYDVCKAQALEQACVRPETTVANVTVFRSVREARRASLRMRHEGECIAHPDPMVFTSWATCEHLRVGNVLVIIPPGVMAAHHRTLSKVLRMIGSPTTS